MKCTAVRSVLNVNLDVTGQCTYGGGGGVGLSVWAHQQSCARDPITGESGLICKKHSSDLSDAKSTISMTVK